MTMHSDRFQLHRGWFGRRHGSIPSRWLRLAALVAIAVVLLVIFRPGKPSPVPSVPTTGLDPAIAELIVTTIGEVRRAPTAAEAWGKLGSVLMHYEFVDAAKVSFTQAERLAPEDPKWPYLHGMLLINYEAESAGAKLTRAVELCPERPDVVRLRLAEFLAERGRGAEAERHFQALLQARTNHPVALLGLARLKLVNGDSSNSLRLVKACLSDLHTAKAAHALLATLLQARGHSTEAAKAAQRSAALPPDRPWPDPFWAEAAAYRVGRKAWLEEATTLLDAGADRLAEAEAILEKLLRDYPEDPEIWYLKGWMLNRQQRSAEAESALRQHLRRAPDSPKGHAQLAVALLAQQRFVDAIAVLQAGLLLKPTWRELHSNMGYAWVQLGQDAEAKQHFQQALELDPNYLPSYTALAELNLREGQEKEARRLLQQALALDPADARAQALLQRAGPRK